MKIFLTLALLSLNFIFASPTLAVTSTPSATPTQNMEDKIKLLVQENLSTTEAKLKEKLNVQALVGYVGKITTISSGNLTIDSQNNLVQITSNAQTTYTKDGSTIKATSLAIGDKVIVIGTSVKNGIVAAKRVTVIKDEPNLVKTSAVVAKVILVDTKKKTLTLAINGTNQVLTLSKKSTVKLDTLTADQTIFGIIKEYNGALSISRAIAL